MKRGKPPERRTPLKRGKPPRRTGIRRPLGKDRTDEERFREAVRLRARGRCEACRIHPLAACPRTYAHAHHIVPRSEGRRWPYLHSAEVNGLGVSREHHDWIHSHAREARRLGLLAHRPD